MQKKKFSILLTSFLLLITLGYAVLFYTDFGCFVLALAKSPKKVGAVAPSSPLLAKAITKHIVKKDAPIRVLEVGAGTGVFTEKIIAKLGKEDILDVIEVDAELVEILREKFKAYSNVHIHWMSILDWRPNYKYDYIVSGLPFNALGVDFVIAVLDTYMQSIKNNGILSYFEYIWVSYIRTFFSRGPAKTNYIKSKLILSKFRKNFEFDKDFVLCNVPPAYAYHLKIKK